MGLGGKRGEFQVQRCCIDCQNDVNEIATKNRGCPVPKSVSFRKLRLKVGKSCKNNGINFQAICQKCLMAIFFDISSKKTFLELENCWDERTNGRSVRVFHTVNRSCYIRKGSFGQVHVGGAEKKERVRSWFRTIQQLSRLSHGQDLSRVFVFCMRCGMREKSMTDRDLAKDHVTRKKVTNL